MAYRTILVHLADERRIERLLEPVIGLARRFNAHVIGLQVAPGIPDASPFALPYATELMHAALAAERTTTDKIKAQFERMTANQPFVTEWVSSDAPGTDLAALVVAHARAADLIVASQADPGWDLSPVLDFPERLVMESGRPVLVVPYAGRYATLGRAPALAWAPRREATRAAFDALPLFEGAEMVHVLSFEEEGASYDWPDTSIMATLARHGVTATSRRAHAGNGSVGEELLSTIADVGADLLVMGAYGHSRVREFVFGGTTRHVMRHMTAPTLFSH
jgi:nucleotide-binding universal stress UspA family protein